MTAEAEEPRLFCLLLGAGGHAGVLVDCLRLAHPGLRIEALDADPKRWGTDLLGVPVVGGDDRVGELVRAGASRFVVGVGGVGDNRPRRALYERALRLGLVPLEVRHPSAVVSEWARLGRGCQLLPGAVVNAMARLGEHVIVNSGAIVEHDCELGDHCHVASGARLASGVRVGPMAHVGVGASVRQGIRIGERSVVGAGAAVVRDVPDGVVVAGVPARFLRSTER